MEHPESRATDEPPAIVERTDGGGAWSKAWPLIALALIGLVAVRACVQPPAAPAPPAAAATTSR